MAFAHKKLFGPFKGLNGSQSPFLRELPPAPNAAPQEYAREMVNLMISPETQELLSRNGIELMESGAAKATSGLFKWIDYDVITGKPRERAIQLSIDLSTSRATVHVYSFIECQLRATDSSLSYKKFGIIEDPDASFAKRYVLFNADGTRFATYTSPDAIPNTVLEYIDYAEHYDGTLIADSYDLLEPAELISNAGNNTPASTARFLGVAKYTCEAEDLDLTSWTAELSDVNGALFTAAQLNNVLYFSGGGTCATLKYDGRTLYKAGMPHAAIAGGVDLDSCLVSGVGTSDPSITAASGDVVGNGAFFGLVGKITNGSPSVLTTIGDFGYAMTYEHGDAKNNYIEGPAFIRAFSSQAISGTSTTTADNITPEFARFSSMYTPGLAWAGSNVWRYRPKSLLPATGYSARGAVLVANVSIVSGDPLEFEVDPAFNTLLTADSSCLRATYFHTFGADPIMIEMLITAKISELATDNVIYDVNDYIQVEVLPAASHKAIGATPAGNSFFNSISDVNVANVISAIESISTWSDLLEFDFFGIASGGGTLVFSDDFVISNNLRINIYRNKDEGEAGSFLTDENVIPNYYLHNIIPNDPFETYTYIGPYYDNAYDNLLGRPLENQGNILTLTPPTTVTFEDVDYSTLPKGRAISSFKGRLYITDDIENVNIIHRSNLLYGAEVFNVNDTLNVETSVGDSVKTVVGNGEIVFILKGNSTQAINNDLSNDNIRIDDVVIGELGCTSAQSAQPLMNGVAFMSPEGPAFIAPGNEPQHLGSNKNGLSRIRDTIRSDRTLDLGRAWAWVDHTKEHYILNIPYISKKGAGLYNPADLREAAAPDHNNYGRVFVYDYANDAWFEQAGINAKAGIVDLEGRLFYLRANAQNTSETVSTLEWHLYKERAYGNLWSYADYVDLTTGPELRGIETTYTTDWLAFEDPNLIKKFLRCKVYGLRNFDEISIKLTDGSEYTWEPDYTLDIEAYKDWRTDFIQSASSVSLTPSNLYSIMKNRPNKASVMSYSLTHDTIYKTPRIQGIEIEVAPPYAPKMGRWGTDSGI